MLKLCHALDMPNTDDCLRLFRAVAEHPYELTVRYELADALREAGRDDLGDYVHACTRLTELHGEKWFDIEIWSKRYENHSSKELLREARSFKASEIRQRLDWLGALLLTSKRGRMKWRSVTGLPDVVTLSSGHMIREGVWQVCRTAPVRYVRILGLSVQRYGYYSDPVVGLIGQPQDFEAEHRPQLFHQNLWSAIVFNARRLRDDYGVNRDRHDCLSEGAVNAFREYCGMRPLYPLETKTFGGILIPPNARL